MGLWWTRGNRRCVDVYLPPKNIENSTRLIETGRPQKVKARIHDKTEIFFFDT